MTIFTTGKATPLPPVEEVGILTRSSVAVVSWLLSMTAFQSCIFEADPQSSNSPPYITHYSPQELFIEITPPVDSIMFSLSAGDPDGDELFYSYALVDDDGIFEEVLSHGREYLFKPGESGFYCLQGRVKDRSDFVVRDWYVIAGARQNGPPLIVRYAPDQDYIAVHAGSSLGFMIEVEDDHPEFLRFSYYKDGEPKEFMSEDPSVQIEFMEYGLFDVTGLVWDGEYGDTISWVVMVGEESDSVAPARITDLAGWVGDAPGTISLQWTATGDDALEGRATCYLIRTHALKISNEYDWGEASWVEGEPSPDLPGTTEKMIVGDLDPGSWIYVTARAVDEFGNMSFIGNCIRVLVRGDGVVDGYITDACTGAALEGIIVSSGEDIWISTADGYYMFAGNDLSGDFLMFRDEEDVSDQGDYYDISIPLSGLDWHFSEDLSMMPYFDMVNVMSGTYDENFYTFFRHMTDTKGLYGKPTIFRNWDHFPVTVYSPPFSWEGVDIQELARLAIDSWNNLTGHELFVTVDEPGTADVEIIYDAGDEDKHHIELVSTNEDGTPAKMLIWIYPNHQVAPIQIVGRKIFAHELGHILQLGHSYDLGHLMVGGTSPITNVPTEDEINLIRSLYGLPTIFDASWHLDE